jgi:dihydroxyacetone kinase-like predicted kinase
VKHTDVLARLDGAVLRAWVTRAVERLHVRRAELDELNVFPVADSDTGTNLYLTLRGGLESVGDEPADASPRAVGRALTRGTLVGARGNSGVIVSQYLGALLGALPDNGTVDGAALVQGLRRAADAAYGAVAQPIEGTVLTVARAVENGATRIQERRRGAIDVLEGGIDAGYAALGRTTQQLAALREAGVFDAGAWGLLLVLDALADAVAGPARSAKRVDRKPSPPKRSRSEACGTDDHDAGEFEVMYLVEGGEGDVAAALRGELSAIGESVAVVGGAGLWQAHVHTDRPLDAVAAAAGAGYAATQIRVRHIASQSGVHGIRRPPLGLVTVTAAPGLVADLARAGAVVVLVPGQVAGPELERAVDDTGATTVLVLVADDLVANHTRALPDRFGGGPPAVRVVEGLSEVQVVAGAATLASLDPDLGEARLADEVVGAVGRVRTATAVLNGVGLARHAEVVETARSLLAPGSSLLTVLVSAQTPASLVDHLRAAVAGGPGDVEVVVLDSGAPGDRIVLGVE